MTTNALAVRSFLLGVACGGRTLTGLAAVASGTDPGAAPGPLRALTGTAGRRGVALAALGELLADKLPAAPSRLAAPSLAGRLAVGAVAASLLSAREGRGPAAFAVLGAAGALAGSVAGARWRAFAQQREWPALAAATAEDLAVAGLAAFAARRGD